MVTILLISCFFLSFITLNAQVSPSWVRDNNVDAGEVKAINFDVCSTSKKTAGYTNTYTQTYNKTNFSVIPRVSMAQLSFDFYYTSSVKIGYQITMGVNSLTNFKFFVKTFGVTICGIHFIYIAVSPIYDAYIFMAVYNNSFTSSDAVSNTSLGATRSQTLNLNYPNNLTLPADTSNYKLQTWILWYLFTPHSTYLAVNTSSAFANTTQFSLTVQAWAGMELNELGVTVVLVNTLSLFQYSYAIFLDVIINNQPGTGNPIDATSTTITDFNSQYFYRNTLFGITGGFINFTASPGLTFFYYNVTSDTQSLFSGYGFNMRTRLCDSSHTFYFYENMTCIPNCPFYYYTNVSNTYCILCHYSCQNCTQPSNSTACSLCDSAMLRTLTNSTCACMPHYFDNNTLLCSACEPTCLTCSNSSANNCLTCDSSLNRVITNNTCPCATGYYQNNTCMSCSGLCTVCSYNTSTTVYTCQACTANRTVDSANNSCICLPAYYAVGADCQPCSIGCLNCTAPTACSLCDTTNHWTLSNGTCSCALDYFQNSSMVCQPCHQNCLTCSNNAINNCLTCNATLNRQLTNSTCTCSTGYYDNSAVLCPACPTGCLVCNNASFCTSCDTSNNWVNVTNVCSCPPTFSQSGTICISNVAVCGNGVLQASQQCDDDNVVQGDGCSSVCTIQTDFSCINNATLYPYSLCYYSGTIALNVNYVYKVPLQNSVQLSIGVSAQNINQNTLKNYLQTQTAVVFANSSRLLAASSIIEQTTVYDTQTHLLKIDFTYTTDVDLSTVSIHFVPSLTTGPTTKYFYLTPQARAILYLPDNKLLTTFASDSQILKLKTISWVFLGLIVASWIFLFVSIAYNQGAVAIEYFLVLQTTYQSLLQSGFIYDGWIGLVLFGKYTYGINIDQIVDVSPHDTLNTIGLTVPLLNTLNITVAFLLLATVVLIAIFLYETADHFTSKDKQIEELSDKGTEAKVVPNRLNEQIDNQSYQIKRGVAIFSLQVAFALIFLTTKIVTISTTIAIKQSVNVSSYLLPVLVASGCQFAILIFYNQCYSLQFLQELSYRRLMRELKSVNSQIRCGFSLSNAFVKYHYPILLTLTMLYSLVNSLTSLGIAFYIILIVGAITWNVVTLINRTYLRKGHAVRVTINTICFIAMMILLLLQTINVVDPSQIISPSLIGLVILSVTLGINVGVFINIEYRRRRKRLRSNKVHNTNAIIIRQNNITEGPIEPNRQEREINERVHIDTSQIELGGKQKFQDFAQHNDSREYTQKKIIPNNRDHQMTKQKPMDQSWEGGDKEKMDQTRPKGWNIQKQEILTKMEPINSRRSVNGKSQLKRV